MKTAVRALAALLGVGLFAWFVVEAGPADIVGTFSQLGASSVLILLPYLLVYGLDTLGWHYAFTHHAATRLTYFVQFRLRMAGEAINNLIPAAGIGGEPVKVYLAHKHGLSTVQAAQSVVVAKTTMTLAETFFIAMGALAATWTLPPGSTAYRGMLAMTVVAALVVALLFWLQSHGMFSTVLALLRRAGLRLQALESRAENLRELDDTIARFYRSERSRFFWSTFFHLLGWIAGLLEVLLVCHLLGVPIHWTQALAIEAFAAVAKGVGVFVPGSIGVQESGIVFLFRVFGLPDALGVAYAILRRGRELAYVCVGGALLLGEETSLGRLAERVRAQAAER